MNENFPEKKYPAALTTSPLSGNLDDIFEDWITSLKKNTRLSYGDSIRKFSGWALASFPEVRGNPFVWLFTLNGVEANRVALRFREYLREEDLSVNTVITRLEALRSFGSMLHSIGVIPWTFVIAYPARETYRDTKGPGPEGVRLLLQVAEENAPPRGIRDGVIVLMLYTLGLRVSELCAINVEDIDLLKRRVHILGKGRTKKEWATLPVELYRKILSWLEERAKYAPAKRGPLILTFNVLHDTSAVQDRMGRHGIFFMIRRLGKRAGIPGLHPHALRHSAITEVLRNNGGNIAKAMRFSRHKDPKTVMVYDDNLQDAPGEAAAELSRGLLAGGKNV